MKRGRLVLVDDEPITVELLSRLLESEGFELVVCSSPQTAAAAVRTVTPDAVVLGPMKGNPRGSGIDILYLLRAELDGQTLPALMYVPPGISTTDQADHLSELGCAVLQCPFNLNTLVAYLDGAHVSHVRTANLVAA